MPEAFMLNHPKNGNELHRFWHCFFVSFVRFVLIYLAVNEQISATSIRSKRTRTFGHCTSNTFNWLVTFCLRSCIAIEWLKRRSRRRMRKWHNSVEQLEQKVIQWMKRSHRTFHIPIGFDPLSVTKHSQRQKRKMTASGCNSSTPCSAPISWFN